MFCPEQSLLEREIAHLHALLRKVRAAHTCPGGRCQGVSAGRTVKRPHNDIR
jgi:hypothetical protein